MIRIEHLCKRYEESTPLTDLCVEIEKGDVISVIGPSGTGKSTLLRMINLLERPTSGDIWLEGELITAPGYDATRARRRMGMVFQQFNLFEHLTVVENVMVAPVELLGKSRQEAYDRALDLLEGVGLRDRAKSYPSELSGGQKQRVAIVRAIAMNPQVLLLDEPTSALDPKMVQEVHQVIQRLADQGTTMVIVTHEMEFARTVANRVLYLDQGVVYEQGTPDQVFGNPKRDRTREFIFKDRLSRQSFVAADLSSDKLLGPLGAFAKANRLDRATAYRLGLALEESVMRALLPVVPASCTIGVEMLYLEDSEGVRVTIRTSGPRIDSDGHVDRLSRRVLGSLATDVSVGYEDGAGGAEGASSGDGDCGGVNTFAFTVLKVQEE